MFGSQERLTKWKTNSVVSFMCFCYNIVIWNIISLYTIPFWQSCEILYIIKIYNLKSHDEIKANNNATNCNPLFQFCRFKKPRSKNSLSSCISRSKNSLKSRPWICCSSVSDNPPRAQKSETSNISDGSHLHWSKSSSHHIICNRQWIWLFLTGFYNNLMHLLFICSNSLSQYVLGASTLTSLFISSTPFSNRLASPRKGSDSQSASSVFIWTRPETQLCTPQTDSNHS